MPVCIIFAWRASDDEADERSPFSTGVAALVGLGRDLTMNLSPLRPYPFFR